MKKTLPILPDMHPDVARFHEAAKEIFSSIVQALQTRETPPVIYHYTNDSGLRGILESGKLWLVDIFSLNDPSELSHGFSHAVSILNDKAATGHPTTKLFAQRFEHFMPPGGLQTLGHYFVCAFSSNGDELGQWRAYADNGRGYALGFDAKRLEDAFVNAGEINHLTFDVTYDDAPLASAHRRLIEMVGPLLTVPSGIQLPPGAIPEHMEQLSLVLAIDVMGTALFYKHEAYKCEQEYRFLQVHRADTPAAEVKFRTKAYSLARYTEFDWRSVAADALQSIVIGPAADHAKTCQFATDCLRAFHKGQVEVKRSKIPYRAT
jgi:hypothetical protein